MMINMKHEGVYVGIVSYKKIDDRTDILPENELGAAGWMCGKARSKDEFIIALKDELLQVGLEFIDINDVKILNKIDYLSDIYDVLFENAKNWMWNKKTVWGNIYTFDI